jgi:hypothetical protein
MQRVAVVGRVAAVNSEAGCQLGGEATVKVCGVAVAMLSG